MSKAVEAANRTAAELERTSGLNATLHWSADLLQAEARRSEETRAALGVDPALFATPVAVKDNIVTVEQPTTCASRILEGYTSPYDATAIQRLRAAGAMVACKTNLDEFAMGSSTEHSAFGRVLHPEFPDLVPGGSSGGSAALVAAGAVPIALGSETGGSVRQPAAFCGIVGYKPSYGRVSRHGLVAFASSLDAISIFSQSTSDAARVLQVISGHDPLDATSLSEPPITVGPARESLEGVRAGLPAEYLPDDLDPGVRAAVDRAADFLRSRGAELVEVSLPHTRYAVPTYYIIAPAEASANLARFDGVRYGYRGEETGDVAALYAATRGDGFGAEVRRRILVGTYVLSAGYYDAYYKKAQQVRALIAADFSAVFEKVDFLLAPTTPTPAFRAGEKTGDPVAMYLADIFVCPANLAGIPAVSIPGGRSEGLPVGIQLLAPYRQDASLLETAMALESGLDRQAEVR